MLAKSRVKYIQSLGQKKFRKQEKLFIAEGPKLVKELLNSNSVIQEIYATSDWIDEQAALLRDVNVTSITEIELQKISQLTTPHQVVAIVEQFDTSTGPDTSNKITLLLDDVQDPGNLGTIIRIADWFGIEHIVCSTGSADLYNPKVIQSTMGSIARVRVYYEELGTWLDGQEGMRIIAATLGGKDMHEAAKLTEGILIIGNEANGISPGILAHATDKITIPKKGSAESLNAAVAAGILLSHLT